MLIFALTVVMYGCTPPKEDDPVAQPQAMETEADAPLAMDECGGEHENAHCVPGRLSMETAAPNPLLIF